MKKKPLDPLGDSFCSFLEELGFDVIDATPKKESEMHEDDLTVIPENRPQVFTIILVENGCIVEKQNSPSGIALKQWVFLTVKEACDFIEKNISSEQ